MPGASPLLLGCCSPFLSAQRGRSSPAASEPLRLLGSREPGSPVPGAVGQDGACWTTAQALGPRLRALRRPGTKAAACRPGVGAGRAVAEDGRVGRAPRFRSAAAEARPTGSGPARRRLPNGRLPGGRPSSCRRPPRARGSTETSGRLGPGSGRFDVSCDHPPRRFWYEQDSDSRLANESGEDHPSAQVPGAPLLFVRSPPVLSAASGGAGVLH